MNSADFIAKALSIARDYKTSYIWGGLGSPITDASLTRAANAYAKNTEKGWIDAARRYAGNPKAFYFCLLYTSPSPRDRTRSRMPSSA